jgi:hypothetical protein
LTCSLLQAVKHNERYVRANDATLLPIDRTVGNLLEWAPVFLGFCWMSMAVTGGWYYFNHDVVRTLRSAVQKQVCCACVPVAGFF